jgi:hypothetical protein
MHTELPTSAPFDEHSLARITSAIRNDHKWLEKVAYSDRWAVGLALHADAPGTRLPPARRAGRARTARAAGCDASLAGCARARYCLVATRTARQTLR